MLKPLLLASAEKLLNHWLYADNGLQNVRQRLAGKTLSIQLTDFMVLPLFCFSANRLDLLANQQQQADCTVTTTLPILRQLKQQQQITEWIRQGKLTIDGDLQVLQQFTQLMEHAQWDWAELFSPVLGDLLSEQLFGRFPQQVEAIKQHISGQKSVLSQTIQEKRLAPTQQATQQIYQQIQRLSVSVELLEQRIERLLASGDGGI